LVYFVGGGKTLENAAAAAAADASKLPFDQGKAVKKPAPGTSKSHFFCIIVYI